MADDDQDVRSQDEESTPDQELDDLELEGYVLQREISRGGQAIIFSAIKKSTGRKVAVKFFPGGSYATRKEKVRMDREVRVLAALDHPNIVSVIDRGQTADGSTYFVLEYIKGKTLAEFIDDFWEQQGAPKSPDDLKELLQLFVRIAEAINAAHLRGVVHRDLKPSNIVIDSYGEPHILDFGVALSSVPLTDDNGEALPSVTWTGEFLGSVQWASPEQAEGDQTKIDVRSDVYSLGIILYEALTGDFPYDVFGSLPEVLKSIISEKPRPPSEVYMERIEGGGGDEKQDECPIDPALDTIVLKGLEKDRAKRYQTAGEFAKAIREYLAGQTKSLRYTFKRPRWPVLVATGVGALVLVLVVFFLTNWHVQRGISAAESGIVQPAAQPPQRGLNIYGYRVEREEVIFEFDVRDYDVARMADGALGSITELSSVNRVAIAGPFNDWDPLDRDWLMTRGVRDRFELRRPLSDFMGRHEWPFKFVINDNVWVSAPLQADNKEVVIEDTATYNLLFTNPLEQADDLIQALRAYRAQINRDWPGQAAHLVQDATGGLHLTLTRAETGTRMRSLKPLSGIPLTSLHLGEMRATDLEVLAGMTNLTWFVCNESTFHNLFFGLYSALRDEDYAKAERAVRDAMEPFANVPVFQHAERLLLNSIQGLKELQENPGERPASAQHFDGRHYLWVVTPLSWEAARLFAESHDGVLATVRSDEHQAWLTTQFGWPTLGRNSWLGGTDEMVRGSWGWLSGDRWRYEHWSPGHPDRADENARAIAMQYDGWWMNLDPAEGRPFIIEWID